MAGQFKTIPLFGLGTKSGPPGITAQRRVNVYYDIRKDGDKNSEVLISTAGLTKLLQLPTFPIRGLEQVGLFAFAVAGQVVYLISPAGGFCAIGTISTAATTPVSIKANESQLTIVDGSFGYVLNNLPALEALATSYKATTLQQLQLLFDINQLVISTYG